MSAERALLNGLGIFAAATFVIFYFDLPLAWYGAAFLAWLVRARSIYQRERVPAKRPFAAEGHAPQASLEPDENALP